MYFLLLAFTIFNGYVGTIKGTVSDVSHGPLAGVNITIQGIEIGASSELDGSYILSNVPVGDHILSISYFGWSSLDLGVSVKEGETTIVNIGDIGQTFSPDSFIERDEIIMQPQPSVGIVESPIINTLLSKNNFAIIPCQETDFYYLYRDFEEEDCPVILTSDLILHTTHIFFNYLVRILEYQKLAILLESLTTRMNAESERQYKQYKNPLIKEAARRNLAYFSVGFSLLNPQFTSDKIVGKIVTRELALIQRHNATNVSPLFQYTEDYTQFKPRGHYTRNHTLENYFKAMMWYGRMQFYLDSMTTASQVILISKILNESPEIYELWNTIFNTITFLVGETDDINYQEIIPIVQEIFGKAIELNKTMLDTQIHDFISRAEKLRNLRIISLPSPSENRKNFHFMGQRFIFDSYILSRLVWPFIGRYTGKGKPFTLGYVDGEAMRCFPRGLDLMAVIGSKKAEDILQKEGDTKYENYKDTIEKLKVEFDTYESKSVYDYFLKIIKDLILTDHMRSPKFMNSEAWRYKEINTGLGFWSELRHDVILYAKMSATSIGMEIQKERRITALVEPYPIVYKYLGNLISRIEEYLNKTDLLIPDMKGNFKIFINFLEGIEQISQKELKGIRLTKSEEEFIRTGWRKLALVLQFPKEYLLKVVNATDKKTPVIADVHSDYNSGLVVEEGIGNPDLIYVKINLNGSTTILKGGVFSHYEFKLPMVSRLTDEEWQSILKTGNAPQRQPWMYEIIARGKID